MKRLLAFCLFLIPPISPVVCQAEGLSLGVGYPNISIKYDFNKLALEGRIVTGSGVEDYAGRGYWNFRQSDSLKGFIGLEGGYVKFNTLDTKGTGSEVALFVGGEYFIAKQISLMMDFAPTLISLESGDKSVNDVEYIANIGFYYHFGRSQPKAKTANAGLEADKTMAKSDEVPEVSSVSAVITSTRGSAGSGTRTWLVQIKSPNWQERRKAAFELGKMKSAEAIDALLELLGDENKKVCGVAALALGRIGDKRALKPLIERLEDKSAYIRASAAKALGNLCDKQAIKPLKTTLKDRYGQVRKAAEEALQKIGAQ